MAVLIVLVLFETARAIVRTPSSIQVLADHPHQEDRNDVG